MHLAPPGSENVNAYCLHIAEDDGEVDTDFPPLDSNEPIHKFGFSTLALVEKFSSPGLASRQSLFVRMLVFHLLLKLKPGFYQGFNVVRRRRVEAQLLVQVGRIV